MRSFEGHLLFILLTQQLLFNVQNLTSPKIMQNKAKTTKRSAFALVLAIGAMAFMVLLTLTLSSIVSSKLRILNSQKQARQARANALLGMSVAISDLQRTLGKDNAISFQASIFDMDVDTPSIESVRTPYALGVYKIEKNTSSMEPIDIQENQRAAIDEIKNGGSSDDVTWLISGEKRMENPVIESPDELSDEAVTLATYKNLIDYPALFGGKVTSDLKSEEVEVRAGKVSLSNGGQADSGAYAFWISDESMKAKINLTRPEKYLDTNTEDAEKCEAPSDSRVPQISNLSFVNDLETLCINPFLSDYNEENASRISRISVLSELPLVSTEYEQWAKDNIGDYTASSVGLAVDVTQGRLKEDLTVYLQQGVGLNDKTPIIRGSSDDKNYTGTTFGIEDFSKGLPMFGLLKDFATLAENKTSFNDSVAPEARVIDPNRTPQHGIYPLIKTIKWVMLPAYSVTQSKGQNIWEITPGNSPTVGLSLMFYPRIVIWNPHNVGLEASDYLIRLYMPYKLYVSPRNNYYSFFTRWREYTVDEEGNETRGDIKYVMWRAQQFMRDDGHFGYFLKQKSDNGMPVMTFQVKNLALRPGESVELNIRTTGGSLQTYKDVDINSLGGNDNLLEAGSITAQDGPNSNCIALERKCIKIDTGYTFRITSMGTTLENPAELSFENNSWKSEDGKRVYRPMSWEIASNSSNIVDKYPAPYLELASEEEEGNANLRGWKILLSNKNGSLPQRCGYELFTTRNGLQRLVKDDLTEWNSASSPNSSLTNRKQAYGNGEVQLDMGNVMQYKFSHSETDGNYPSAHLVINPEEVLFDSDMGDEDVNRSGRIVYVTIDEQNQSGLFYSNGDLMKGLKLQNLFDTGARIFTSSNMLASGTWSGDTGSLDQASDSSSLKRPGGGNVDLQFGVGKRFSGAGSGSYDVFFGKQATAGYIPACFSYRNGTEPSSITPIMNNLKSRYSGGAADSHPNRFGELSFLSGKGLYQYDYTVCAPFDYPRSKYDLMSLGVFNHANLSPYTWQPTFPFAQSYASPYLDRENIIEPKHINENELLDISYVLNASMWDRFYLSSIPQSDMPQEIYAGMRLPNTRLFLTSVPEDKSKLYGSAEALENSAKYVGIDGAFNVNSTSYEAWRAFLGGLLGTKKMTTIGDYINDKSQDSKDSDELKMPNPGDIYPLTTPYDGKYSWVDTIVGRTISESEIDLLAREIVAEVKRRAPFFSLADFVNRRLYKYESGEDEESLNIRYQSLMGTLAAAIRRAELNESRKPSFFNDKSFDENIARIDSNDGKSFVYTANLIRAFDNVNGGGSWKRDLGAEVKEAETQYMEQAICSPILGDNWVNQLLCVPGLLSDADILQQIGSLITVRGDTFLVRAYGEAINAMTGTSSKAYCEAIVQRTTEPVDPTDDELAPQSEFGRKFKVISFRWLTPAEI